MQVMEGSRRVAATGRPRAVSFPAQRAAPALLFVVVAACGAATCSDVEPPAGEPGGAASPVAASESTGPSAEAEQPAEQSGPAAGATPRRAVQAPPAAVPAAPAAVPAALSSPEHQRYQALRVETLRAMIEAAQLALPIGPFQERIDAAARVALEDVAEAADRMEVIVADLREAIAAAGR